MILSSFLTLSAVALVSILVARRRNNNSDEILYVIGDLHGDVHCAQQWVNKTGLLQRKNKNVHIVFLGDYIDKGPTSFQTVNFVKQLTENYPDNVIALLGNHELELLRDRHVSLWGTNTANFGFYQLSYASVHPGEYLHYLQRAVDDTDHHVVELLYNASAAVYSQNAVGSVFMASTADESDDAFKFSILKYIPSEQDRTIVRKRLAEYQQHYLKAFGSQTELGKWLEERPIIHQHQEDMWFVHGGISPRALQYLTQKPDAVETLNQAFRMHAAGGKLPYFLEQTLEGSLIYEMLTYRGNHKSHCLPASENTKLFVGHTPHRNVEIKCDGSLIAADSSLSRYFRNSGNYYCPGDRQVEVQGNVFCPVMANQCQGQIVKMQGGKIELVQ